MNTINFTDNEIIDKDYNGFQLKVLHWKGYNYKIVILKNAIDLFIGATKTEEDKVLSILIGLTEKYELFKIENGNILIQSTNEHKDNILSNFFSFRGKQTLFLDSDGEIVPPTRPTRKVIATLNNNLLNHGEIIELIKTYPIYFDHDYIGGDAQFYPTKSGDEEEVNISQKLAMSSNLVAYLDRYRGKLGVDYFLVGESNPYLQEVLNEVNKEVPILRPKELLEELRGLNTKIENPKEEIIENQ